MLDKNIIVVDVFLRKKTKCTCITLWPYYRLYFISVYIENVPVYTMFA